MPYTPKTWQDAPSTATPITAFELNRIEQGIVAAENTALAIEAQVNSGVVRTANVAQSIDGDKTFIKPPLVPNNSFSVLKIAASGRVGDGTRALHDDGTWKIAATGGTGTGTGSNALGTFNNPVTDPAAARPTGLTRVVWDCATDPTNWALNDYNLQQGT